MEKRIKVKLKKPNPLFCRWLKEWIEEAEKKKKKISKTYQKALNSLEKYPLTLWSGHDCSILEGFGSKICDMLEEKLQQHLSTCSDLDQNLCFKDKIEELKTRDYAEMIDLISSIEAEQLIDDSIFDDKGKSANLSMITEEENDDELMEISDDENQENVHPLKEISEEEENEEEMVLSGNESVDSLDLIIRKYQEKPAVKSKQAKTQQVHTNHTEPPLHSTQPGNKLKKYKSFNTNLAGPSFASSPISIKFVETKVVSKSPKRILKNKDHDELDAIVSKYTSAEEAISPVIPKKRRKIGTSTDDVALSPVKLFEACSTTEKNKDEDDFKYISLDDINTQDYDVILIIDIGEAKSKTNCEIQTKIAKHDVRSEVEKLHIGDFVWVASHKRDKSKKYVLPYVIERKRLDDLASSIKTDRFHEQKFRLKQCGIENVIYLVENLKKDNYGLPFESLTQAIANTLIQNKFQVKVTDDKDHTILYLALMTNFISGIFHNKKPIKFKLMEFEAFNQASVKQRKCTVRETFIKQLLALKGLSVDMAIEICNYFPTPSHLYEKYCSLGKKDGETLLSKITLGEVKRKIPSTVSKTIYNFYMYQK